MLLAKVTVAVLIALLVAGCGNSPLENGQLTADDLGRAILRAFEDRDEVRLRALALHESEFRRQIWPSLPAARPERNLPFSYVWGDLKQKSDTSLARILAAHGGRSYRFVAVRFQGPPAAYAGFRVHRQPSIAVMSAATEATELGLTGSFVEKDGLWKVFSYVVDD
jgi:hypothetical protein